MFHPFPCKVQQLEAPVPYFLFPTTPSFFDAYTPGGEISYEPVYHIGQGCIKAFLHGEIRQPSYSRTNGARAGEPHISVMRDTTQTSDVN